ncbi:MAG: ATP-binding protein, partial [Thermodesulfobacteriota bacterium]
MISKSILKEIIISNQEFIDRNIKEVIPREGFHYPESLKKVVILYGVRRSGKTFILYDLFKRYRDRSLYIDFEDERLSGFQLKDFELLRTSFLELKPELVGKEIVFLLDEIQHVSGWERFCKRAIEREEMRVFLSGSASRMMPFEIHTSLRGRAWSIEVFPFSFKEYLKARNIDIHGNNFIYGAKGILIKNHFSDYLRWGGFPEVCLVESELE